MRWPVEKKVAGIFLFAFLALAIIRFVFHDLTPFDFGLLLLAFYFVSRYSNDRRRSETALAQQLAFTQAITAGLGEGVYAVDTQGRLTFMNPAAERMLGWTQQELLGKNMHEIVHHLRADETGVDGETPPTDRVRDAGEALKNDDTVLWRRDGQSISVAYTSSPIFVNGESTGTVLAFRDIAMRKQSDHELRRAKEAAESANKLKSLFLANMSHELRTPLNAIIGYSEMMLEESEAQCQQQISDITRIRQAGKQLLALINDILDLSKIEAGKMTLYLEVFDLAATIHDVAETIKPIVAQNGNTLNIDCPNHIGQITADLSKLRQCLFNLLTNALKFTRDGTVILHASRTSKADGDWISLSVTDTGIGISKADMTRLFQAFTQADASISSKYGGTGLGLAISRQFCRLMGGDITVESEPGKGSTFTLRLPAVVLSNAEAPPTSAEKAEEARIEPKAAAEIRSLGRVLVIDDDPAVRELLGRTLAADGYDVRSASTGDEGLRTSREWKPHAITLDVLMPGMDGWAVLRLLKSDTEVARIPVIMLSIVGDQNRALGTALGASNFMTKPVDRSRLSQLLQSFRREQKLMPVLIIEDEDDVREMIKRAVVAEGWSALAAASGREALELMASEVPGVILLDLIMPEMNGFEFIAEVQKNEAWRSIPIVVVTARDLSESDLGLLSTNVRKIVGKTAYSREDLLHEVRRSVRACRETKQGSPNV